MLDRAFHERSAKSFMHPCDGTVEAAGLCLAHIGAIQISSQALES